MTADDLASAPVVPAAEYVAAVAQHVASVCVITTVFEGERFGLTATAIASVTATPARLLVCVNKSGLSHDKIVRSGRFCVNVLTEAQHLIATAFAGAKAAERFALGEWTTLATGAPALVDAAASFDCRLAEVCGQSTHSVLFGDVLATRHRAGEDALLYGVRRYRQMRKGYSGLMAGDNDYL
jgi:flavin reductase (DIM6/NTAB) family NADH-FMN oxidoreductase RutF